MADQSAFRIEFKTNILLKSGTKTLAFVLFCQDFSYSVLNVLLFQGCFQPCGEEHVRVLLLTQQSLQAREPLTPQKQGEYYVSWDQKERLRESERRKCADF